MRLHIGPRREDDDQTNRRMLDLSGAPGPVVRSVVARVPPHLYAKIQEWGKEAAALGAPAYRITLTDRICPGGRDRTHNMGKGKGPDGSERTWSAAEVEQQLVALAGLNARGFDIYITPLDSSHHYLVVDDLRAKGLADLRAAGFAPALVIESSSDNFQVILKAPRADHPEEQSIANTLVRELNHRFGGDPNFSGVIHPFRMAAFTNSKPTRAVGRTKPIVRLLEHHGGICVLASQELDRLRRGHKGRAKKSAVAGKRYPGSASIPSPTLSPTPARNGDPLTTFKNALREVRALVISKGWEPNQSKMDFRAAAAMRRAGWTRDQVAVGMRGGSPDLTKRHPDVERYIRVTLDEVQKKLPD